MRSLRAPLFLAFLATAACVDSKADAAIPAAVARLFPGDQWHIWASAEGDLNGDGHNDLALLLTGAIVDGQRPERLVVLAGNEHDAPALLSASGQFCEARHFYNLEIRDRSLYTQVVHRISTNISSTTLQFRYQHARNDLALIGEEHVSEAMDGDDTTRVSVNYLSKQVIYSRANAHGRKELRERFDGPGALPLQGFNCLEAARYRETKSINEDLSVNE